MVLIKVDRKNFLTTHGLDDPYADNARPIGFNTTISSFSIHGSTLEFLRNHLKVGAKCIDIGTGSGFIAACFADLVGKEGKVFMVDHIEQIL